MLLVQFSVDFQMQDATDAVTLLRWFCIMERGKFI